MPTAIHLPVQAAPSAQDDGSSSQHSASAEELDELPPSIELATVRAVPGFDARAAGDRVAATDRFDPVCITEHVAPKEPTCTFEREKAGSAVRFKLQGVSGSLKWCAGHEPMPWVSSSRAAKVELPYEELGLDARPDARAAPMISALIGHDGAIASVLGKPVLVRTRGGATVLRHEDGSLATEVLAGGIHPPTKGALILFGRRGDGSFRIDRDGIVRPIDKPNPEARFVGWEVSGGHSSIWRWQDGAADAWAVVQHRADGSVIGSAERVAPPTACADGVAGARFELQTVASDVYHPIRGQRLVHADGKLCLDRARGEEDRVFYRAPFDRAGSVKVSCDRWELTPRGPGASDTMAAPDRSPR